MTQNEIAGVAAPPESFNFAGHLLDANAQRAGKTAFIDDFGALSYGALAERVKRLAAGLRALGLKREERVLLLMHDGNHWPVAFLGAMYAGVVPVAVNTLLTADDGARSLRGVEWAWDPDPEDSRYLVDYALLLRDGHEVTAVHDRHVEGLFSIAEWTSVLERAGYKVSLIERPLDEDGQTDRVFLCEKR